jgi:hypothetical protein
VALRTILARKFVDIPFNSMLHQHKVQAHLSADMVQRILDENQQLILAVIENQQNNNTHECAQYLQNLQRNLMMLATIGDGQVNGAGGLCSVRAREPPASQYTPADSRAAGRGMPAARARAARAARAVRALSVGSFGRVHARALGADAKERPHLCVPLRCTFAIPSVVQGSCRLSTACTRPRRSSGRAPGAARAPLALELAEEWIWWVQGGETPASTAMPPCTPATEAVWVAVTAKTAQSTAGARRGEVVQELVR